MDLVAEVGSEIDKIEDNNNQIEDVENMVEYNNDFQYVSRTILIGVERRHSKLLAPEFESLAICYYIGLEYLILHAAKIL